MTPAATAAARRAATARAASPARARTAPAPRAPRSAPARRPSRPRPQRSRIVPGAVGRTASAVSGIADTGVFVRLTRGRLWIGVLAVLLVGIVAINVLSLSFGATASRLGREADGLRRANSALRAQLAGRLSDLRIQGAAIRAGLVVPGAGSIRYLRVRPGDAARAARRLSHGDIALGSPEAAVPTATALSAPTTVPTSTATATTTVPAATTVTPTATATTTPTTVAPTTTATTPTSVPTTPATTPTPTGGVTAP